MAEARSAVSIRVPPNLEEGRNSWKDISLALRKSVVRRYYRTRNSIRNGTWPTSTNNLIGACAIAAVLLLGEPDATRPVNKLLWSVAEGLPFLPAGTPRWLSGGILSCIIGLAFFLILMKIRQYILRALLAYRGWLYESMKSQSKWTIAWAILVRMVSGYQPSLYSCQRSLPRLPVPNLKFTLEKLLESLQPLCDKAEIDEIRREAESFEKGLGNKLQNILILKSWWAPNYVTDWWEKYVYLMTRSPIAINSNYYGMDCSYWTPTSHQTVRAATTLHHILTFKRLIDREELPPLVLRNTIPICMAQYERLFSSIRIPGEEVDELRHYDSTVSRHIVVNYLGFYYQVECFDAKNQILNPSSIQSQLDWIIKDGNSKLSKNNSSDDCDQDQLDNEKIPDEAARSIASLTALPRSDWAKIYQKHFKSGVNQRSMKAIKKAILMVTLSTESPTELTERGKKLMHSDGKSIWFDKCVNIIYFKNGFCGLNVEHSFADAPVMGHVWEFTMTKEVIEKWYTDDGYCMPPTKAFRQAPCKLPMYLDWEVDNSLESEINAAVLFAKKNNDDLDLVILDHCEWGKGFIKKCGISPDAFIQIALQMAYFRDAGKFVQTYEASMTRLYLIGRTETVRSCTQEIVKTVEALNDETYSLEDKLQLIKIAADKHQQLYRDAMNGKGIDRHLFALYVLCKGLGYKSTFLEKILMRPWTLSTSQQPQQQLSNVPDANLAMFSNKVSPGGGFGPVSDDGYGISYMLPSDHKIFFHITSKHGSSKTSSTRFAKHIRESMQTLRDFYESKLAKGKTPSCG